MRLEPKYYMHLSEKDPRRINVCWSWIHVIVQLGIIVTSFTSTWATSNILQSYEYNCILYARLQFRTVSLAIDLHEENIENIDLHKEKRTVVTPSTNATATTISNETKEHEERDAVHTIDEMTGITLKEHEKRDAVHTIDEMTGIEFGEHVGMIKRSDHSIDIYHLPGRDRDARMHIYINHTHRMIGEIRLRNTVFATIFMCDMIMIIPLMSMITSLIFISIMFFIGSQSELPSMAMCTFPLMITSIVMTVFNYCSTFIYHNGLEEFCAHFEVFTGEKECTPAMDEFSQQFEQTPNHPFYIWYFIGKTSHYCTLIMWAAQGFLNVLRILCVSDFRVILTRIKLKEKQKDEEDPDADPEEGGKMAEAVAKVMMHMRKRRLESITAEAAATTV